jgi:hypothetical protein
MPPLMSRKTKGEVLERVRFHYRRATTRIEKSHLLNTLCAACGWERKYAIKRVHGRERDAGGRGKGRHGGARPCYGPEVVAVLKRLWQASDQLCGKRLAPVLGLWLTSWEKRHGVVEEDIRRKLLKISPAQIDRLLRPWKSAGRLRPRQANEVRRQVPLRTGPWEESAPGWIEADTVAHGGESLRGPHAWSVVLTDIATGWSEARLCWTRSDLAIHARVCEIENELPFRIRGFDTDNGGEFINATLLRYWSQREVPVEVTRSRPYHKNDNAHVEQKNLVLIRESLGYQRLDVPEAVESFNEALRLLCLRANLYQASAKLLRKEQKTPQEKPRKIYEKRARTPWQRLHEHPETSEIQRRQLENLLAQHDPLELNECIEAHLKEGWKINAACAKQAEKPPIPKVRKS